MSRCKAVGSAGSGNGMHSSQKKQFMRLCGRPVVSTASSVLKRALLEKWPLCFRGGYLITAARRLCDRYGSPKVEENYFRGEERYHSVAAGLDTLKTAIMFLSMTAARTVWSPGRSWGKGPFERRKSPCSACVCGDAGQGYDQDPTDTAWSHKTLDRCLRVDDYRPAPGFFLSVDRKRYQ